MSGVVDNERLRKLLLSSPATAIEILYHRHSRNLLEIALYLTKDILAAEDVVEEAFILLWENRRKLSQYHERSILHYLVKVVKYKAISEYKMAAAIAERKTGYHHYHQSDLRIPPVEETIIENEIRREIREIIARFPAKERECLLMKLDEELTVKEMAERLGVTQKAIERSLTSANKRLRSHWKWRHK